MCCHSHLCLACSYALELDNFHGVLHDLSYGLSTQRVKDFIVQAFVKGMRCGNAHHAELEGLVLEMRFAC